MSLIQFCIGSLLLSIINNELVFFFTGIIEVVAIICPNLGYVLDRLEVGCCNIIVYAWSFLLTNTPREYSISVFVLNIVELTIAYAHFNLFLFWFIQALLVVQIIVFWSLGSGGH